MLYANWNKNFSFRAALYTDLRLRGWIRINTRDFGAEMTNGVTNPSAMSLAAFLRGSRTVVSNYQNFNEVREIYVTFEAPTRLSTRPTRLFKGLNDADQSISEWHCFPLRSKVTHIAFNIHQVPRIAFTFTAMPTCVLRLSASSRC
jgi:hypothetical protein